VRGARPCRVGGGELGARRAAGGPRPEGGGPSPPRARRHTSRGPEPGSTARVVGRWLRLRRFPPASRPRPPAPAAARRSKCAEKMSRTSRTNSLPLLPTRRHAARGLLDELAPDRVPPSAQAPKLGRSFDPILVCALGDDLA